MIRTEKKTSHYVYAAIAGLLAFSLGYVHHRWFYPLQFHGDSAAMHVLAKAIVSQASLLPSDFFYGNQLVFLRASPFIALALVSGIAGPDAFAIGSALSIAFWGVVLYFFLSAFFESGWKAVLFSILLLIPFGEWDFDYVLGQQSHLSNAVLSLGLVVFASLHAVKKDRNFLMAAIACLFIMSLESPIRTLLVLGPVLVALLLVTGSRQTIAVATPMGAAFILAYFLNKWLIYHHPISVNLLRTLSFKSSDEILSNFGMMSRETFGSLSSINLVAGERFSLPGAFVLGAGLLLTSMYLGFFVHGMIRATKLVAARADSSFQPEKSVGEENESRRLIQLISVFGFIFGALAVAALNPDSSRHYLWSVFLAKMLFLVWVLERLAFFLGRKKAVLSAMVLAFFMSSWFAYLVKSHWNTTDIIRNRNATEAVASIEEVSRKTGIKHIYGDDFWRMMPLNTLLPSINAQALLIADGDVHPFAWLTVKSWSCTTDALYYLKGGKVDDEIKRRLIDAGGKQMKVGAGYAIWRGPRVWRVPSASRCVEQKGTSVSTLRSNAGP